MADLILRPSTLVEGKPWALQLRYHDSCGPTDYLTITRVSAETARAIVDAGAPYYLFGEPPETPAPSPSLPQNAIDKPAQVGSVIFREGVSADTVIQAAQRYHQQMMAEAPPATFPATPSEKGTVDG